MRTAGIILALELQSFGSALMAKGVIRTHYPPELQF